MKSNNKVVLGKTKCINFDLNGSNYMLRELPAGYYPSNMYPHASKQNNYVCCIKPDGYSDLLYVPEGHYELLGLLDDITELGGQKWNPPTGCHAGKYALLKVI